MFLREEDFKFLEFLKEKFLRRASKFAKEAKGWEEITAERAVERRSLTKTGNAMARFEYESSGVIEWTRESLYWSWQRVKEYHRQMTEAERYEQLVKEIKI